MRRISLLLILGVILVWAGAAAAIPPAALNGQYAYIISGGCVVSTLGFRADFTPVPGSLVFTIAVSGHGVRTFNGDGTGTTSGTTVNTASSPNASGSSQTGSQDFTYILGDDGSIAVQSGPSTATILTGPRAGKTFTRDPLAPSSGMISNDHKTITLATDGPPVVETATTYNSDGTVYNVSYEICHQTTVLIK